jgi:putative transposase
MARKLRLEYPGAIYHVINRGNYRTWIFREPKTRTAFQTCLFEACERSRWLLHAFVVMGNHFHLAIETPLGNLVVGMHWLLATFATRFNRMRHEQGHLFQGRYKSLFVEEGGALGLLCDYIHLNPVRACIMSAPLLANYAHSSYCLLQHPARRPNFLRVDTSLAAAGGLTDSPAGRRSYQEFLEWQAAEGPAGKSKAYVNLSRGWALGSGEFKAALVQDLAVVADPRALEGSGALEVKQHRWSIALAAALQDMQKSRADLHRDRKSAHWKLLVAARMKRSTDASNRWLAENLNLGTPAALSHNLTLFHRQCAGSALSPHAENPRSAT